MACEVSPHEFVVPGHTRKLGEGEPPAGCVGGKEAGEFDAMGGPQVVGFVYSDVEVGSTLRCNYLHIRRWSTREPEYSSAMGSVCEQSALRHKVLM